MEGADDAFGVLDHGEDEADASDAGEASEAAALRKQLDELRAKIDQLTAMQKNAPE